jgi:hypothetical protein
MEAVPQEVSHNLSLNMVHDKQCIGGRSFAETMKNQNANVVEIAA